MVSHQDARRFDEGRSDGLAPGFQVGLQDWADSLGILSSRLDKVRDALGVGYRELVELMLARGVKRGMASRLTGVFPERIAADAAAPTVVVPSASAGCARTGTTNSTLPGSPR